MEVFENIYKDFVSLENKKEAVSMAHYMQDHFLFFGVKSNIRKEIEKPYLQYLKKDKYIDWDLVFKCFNDEHRELQYFAIDYLRSKEKYLSYDDVDKLYILATTKQWWDTIDFLDRLIGNIGLKDKRIDQLMIDYSNSKDIWLRRIAIDHQNGRKDKTNIELLSKIILNNIGTNEFFINKAIGWALRDYSKANSNWVKEFINANKNKLSNLSIREASKYLK